MIASGQFAGPFKNVVNRDASRAAHSQIQTAVLAKASRQQSSIRSGSALRAAYKTATSRRHGKTAKSSTARARPMDAFDVGAYLGRGGFATVYAVERALEGPSRSKWWTPPWKLREAGYDCERLVGRSPCTGPVIMKE